MEEILNKILAKLDNIESNQTNMQADITEIKSKIDSVYDQTADLTEFRTETNDTLKNVSQDVKFIKHKVRETEEDVFTIQSHLKIIK